MSKSKSGNSSARQKRVEQAQRLAWLEVQAPLGWAMILVLAALLGAIYLGQTSNLAAVGRHAQTLQFDLDVLKRENAVIERQIAEAQALDRLEDEARRLGFRAATPIDLEYLVVPDFPATTATPALESAPTLPRPIDTIEEALWITLQTHVTSLFRGAAGER